MSTDISSSSALFTPAVPIKTDSTKAQSTTQSTTTDSTTSSSATANPTTASSTTASSVAASSTAANSTTVSSATSTTTATSSSISSALLGDQVTLSPKAQALLKTQTAQVTAKAPLSDAEKEARAAFMRSIKLYFAKNLGISESKLGDMDINDDALRYIIRNTAMGAMAPPGLRAELGVDAIDYKTPKAGTAMGKITLNAADGMPYAHFAFDPGAMEALKNAPINQKDKDGDGMFTTLDLLRNTRALSAEQTVKDSRFNEADRAFTTADRAAARASMAGGSTAIHEYNRILQLDDTGRPYFMARLRDDVKTGHQKGVTATLVAGLLGVTR